MTRWKLLLIAAVASGGAHAAPPVKSPPEEIVTFYLDAARRGAIDEMLSVRDLKRQAYSDLFAKQKRPPNSDAVALATRELEERIKKSIASRTPTPRTCSDFRVRYDATALATVMGVCRRDLGRGSGEHSVIDVALILTKAGWRIVNDGADVQ